MPLRSQTGEVLSGDARITLLTCTPGPDLYSVFGHSAIRVEDQSDSVIIDEVYNYGTFEFDEGFYTRFVMGELDYSLSRSDFGTFQLEYIYTGRGIYEQELLLDSADKQILYDLLIENYQPVNRKYRYDYFLDNCSSRIRDMVRKAVGEKVAFTHQPAERYTFRQAIDRYLWALPWSDFGIDLALGMPCDREMAAGEDMFLPDSLLMEFNLATYGDRELCGRTMEILPAEYIPEGVKWGTPIQVFSLVLVIQGLVYLLFRRRSPITFVDRAVMFLAGLVGGLISFLWFFTDHQAAASNFNILWANPLYLFLTFVPASRVGKKTRILFIILLALHLILLAGWWFIPQDLHEGIIPITVGLGWSAWRMIRNARKEQKTS